MESHFDPTPPTHISRNELADKLLELVCDELTSNKDNNETHTPGLILVLKFLRLDLGVMAFK